MYSDIAETGFSAEATLALAAALRTPTVTSGLELEEYRIQPFLVSPSLL
jgi:hypothetical protein